MGRFFTFPGSKLPGYYRSVPRGQKALGRRAWSAAGSIKPNGVLEIYYANEAAGVPVNVVHSVPGWLGPS